MKTIKFNPEMFQAITAGRKTQTRQLIKSKPSEIGDRLLALSGNDFRVVEVLDVQAQRVQKISEEDAKKEGVEYVDSPSGRIYRDYNEKEVVFFNSTYNAPDLAVGSFETLWNSIYLRRGYGWRLNPWVWAYTFKLI